jgi:hypothetical protein
LFQNACAPVLKLFPFTTIVNGTLFVGALFGVSEEIARGLVMPVVKVALVAPGAPHANINRVRLQIPARHFRSFMSKPVVSG